MHWKDQCMPYASSDDLRSDDRSEESIISAAGPARDHAAAAEPTTTQQLGRGKRSSFNYFSH